jgi:hypothetical protein
LLRIENVTVTDSPDYGRRADFVLMIAMVIVAVVACIAVFPGHRAVLATTLGARLERQPTPASVKRAEKRAQAQFAATLARAKRLEARNDRAGCMRALEAAKGMYNLN